MGMHMNPALEREWRSTVREAIARNERKAKMRLEAIWICGSVLLGLAFGYAMTFITRLLYR